MSIWFVTPAWQRFEITAICLEQRRRMMDQLNAWGHETYSVVVADDANAETARGFGFSVVETNNDWLGRKFNDGIEYAYRHGATWIVPIGSDSWLDPWYLKELPPANPKVVRTSELYVPVERDRLALLRVASERNPAGPHCFHRQLVGRRGGRPMPDKINRHTDSNTLRSLRPFQWQYNDVQPLQYIGFRVKPFITSFEELWKAWGVAQRFDPWDELARYYDRDLVERAREVMS